MSDMIEREALIPLSECEIGVQVCRQNIETNIFMMARYLVHAKAQVAHGDWTRWLEKYADMSDRTAQSWMAAYRRFGDKPDVARIGKTKMFKLLALPEGLEEEFTQTHDIEAMSTREIEAAVKKAREEAREELYGELQRERAARRNAEERAQQMAIEQSVPRQQLQELLDERNACQEEIVKLNAELKEQDDMLREQQAMYDRAQTELLDARSALARSDAERSVPDTFTAEALAQAVRQFVGSCSMMPQMKNVFADMSQTEKSAFELSLRTVEKWCQDAREALSVTAIEGVWVS